MGLDKTIKQDNKLQSKKEKRIYVKKSLKNDHKVYITQRLANKIAETLRFSHTLLKWDTTPATKPDTRVKLKEYDTQLKNQLIKQVQQHTQALYDAFGNLLIKTPPQAKKQFSPTFNTLEKFIIHISDQVIQLNLNGQSYPMILEIYKEYARRSGLPTNEIILHINGSIVRSEAEFRGQFQFIKKETKSTHEAYFVVTWSKDKKRPLRTLDITQTQLVSMA